MTEDKGEKQELAEERTERAEERTEFAEERTEWADQRTYLAQQRTFAGWVRTGLTSMAVGFGVIEFMGDVEPAWLISAIGAVLIIIGAVVEAVAFVSFRSVTHEMAEGSEIEMEIPVWWTAIITGGLILVGAAGLVVVFF